MSIPQVSSGRAADIMDCIPFISLIYNLFEGVICSLFNIDTRKSLASRALYSIPIVGNLCKITELASRYLCCKTQTARPQEAAPLLLQESAFLIHEPERFVRAGRDIVQFIGKNNPGGLKFEFSPGSDAALMIQNFKAEVSGICERTAVASDGHCLFRSIAYGILSSSRNNEVLKQALSASLDDFLVVYEAQGRRIDEDVSQAVTFLKTVIRASHDPYALLNNQERSDRIVKSLRILACAYNNMKKDSGDASFNVRYQENLSTAERLNLSSYLRDMCAVTPGANGKFGSELELVALSDILGFRALLCDFQMGIPIYNPISSQKVLAAPFTVSLMLRLAHFDHLNLDPAFVNSKFAS